MGGLAAFLTARLDETQQLAEAYLQRRHAEGIDRETWAYKLLLREVEAGRAILALHRPELWNADDDPADIHCAECTADEDLYKAQIWPCPTVRHLVAVYSDHPDYDEAWKP
jgi:hypothetical protein